MSKFIKYDSFISVGIDVGADFSWMSIALPNQTFVGKPFKILHSDLNSLSMTVSNLIKLLCQIFSLYLLTILSRTYLI